MNNAITLPRPSVKGIRARDYILPAAIALACAGAAYAGADTTFDPALQKFTDFLEGSGGKIITVLSLAGGLIALASGRFALGQVAVPVGVGIGVGTGVLIGFWTIDEFAGLLVPFAWGILAQHIIIGTGLSVMTWFALRKAKASGAGSKLVHAAYWYLPGSFLGLKATPPSHCRLLAG